MSEGRGDRPSATQGLSRRIEDLTPEQRVLLESRLLERARPGNAGIPLRPPGRVGAELSFAQQRLWFLDRLLSEGFVYNLSMGWRLFGALDAVVLERSLRELELRHEVLRTVFPEVGEGPVQVVADEVSFQLELTDLSGLGAGSEEELQRLAREEARRSFDLASGPVWRGRLFRMGSEEHVLVVTMHHIVSDAWSLDLMVRELTALYGAFLEGRGSPLPRLPIQYADYAVWQRGWLQGDVLERQLEYWRGQLSRGVPVLDLPTDRRRPAVQTFRGAQEEAVFPPGLLGGLEELSRGEGVTLFMTLLAAFDVLLFRYTGQRDVAVGSPIAGRTRVETEGLIGFFVNTLVLRTDLSGDPTFRQLLGRVREVALGAYGHQDLPFERLVEELQPERSLSHTPLFQVMFQLRTVSGRSVEFAGVRAESFRLESGVAKFDLTFQLVAGKDRLRGVLQYNAELFEPATIQRMLEHFGILLGGILANPDQKISRLPLMSPSERRHILLDWNQTTRPYSRNATVHELFEKQTQRSPEAVALVGGSESVTYEQLNEQANRLARYLRALGVGPDVVVGVCLERSIAMVVAMLGVLKAGGAYLPLDPTYPAARLAFMMEQSGGPVVLTKERFLSALGTRGGTRVCLDRDAAQISGHARENSRGAAAAENLAYVLYTSGSTGKPKGVMVPHRGVVRLVAGSTYAPLDRETTMLHVSPESFDASTFEIWGPLLNGGRCVVSAEGMLQATQLGELLRSGAVTTAWLTASLFNAVVDADVGALSGLDQLLTGGEALSVPHVRAALAALPGTRITNGYGPTESTTFACCHSIDGSDTQRPSIPIGRPIANTRVYVLDPSGAPVPVGVRGELYIGGDGLARGYLREPAWTADRFVPDPFSSSAGERLYRTGDVARWMTDGSLEFLGRTDHQVKVRGFRIELGEVEAALLEAPGVLQAALDWEADGSGSKRLIAYFAARSPAPTAAELRANLARSLPDYMMPSRFVLLEAIPLTSSGKIDRLSLPEAGAERDEPELSLAPRNAVEEGLMKIWAEVLDLDRIDVHDNFFHIGGHSILAIRVFSRIRDKLQVDLPLRAIFEAPTIAGLAARIEEAGNRGADPAPSITAVSRETIRRHSE